MGKAPMKASDSNDLERHILDPNIAKSEAAWWAKGRIEELEREVARLTTQSANRLIGLCKCGIRSDELQADNKRLRDMVEECLDLPTLPVLRAEMKRLRSWLRRDHEVPE